MERDRKLHQLIDWIRENCFTIVGGLNNHVTNREKWWISKSDRYEYLLQLEDQTSYIQSVDNDIPLRIWHLLNGPDIPACQTCQKTLKLNDFVSYGYGYSRHCSKACGWSNLGRRNAIGKAGRNNKEKFEKNRLTNNVRYGANSIFQTEDFKAKSKKSKIERYGNEYYSNQDKIEQTNLERYGVKSKLLLPDVQKEMFDAKVRKYGHAGPFHESYTTSKPELEILEYLNFLVPGFKKSKTTLGVYELDAFNEDRNIAVEYCGLYWHTEQFRLRDYHYKKYQLCQDKGIKLITIFEDEWLFRKDQVKQFLKAQLYLSEITIPARKCRVEEITAKNFDFFEKNHIQGRPNQIKYCFGLFYEENMIGSVSYANHHRKSEILALNRLAFDSSCRVQGGPSKLIKNSLQIMDVNKVVTWSDNRWSNGLIYEKAGFELDAILPPDYSYVVNDGSYKRKAKQQFQKKRMGIPADVTEHEYCLSKKIFRIYDCGKKRWVFKNNKKERSNT